MKHMVNKKRIKGNLGEDFATMFLVEHGFGILRRNYQKKCGEIDIIAEKSGIIHFVEVKSVSRETYNRCFIHLPEENVSNRKISKIEKTANLFLMEYKLEGANIEIDLITVEFWAGEKEPRLNYLPNINF